MNKTTSASAYQLLAIRPIGLTSGAQAGSRRQPMTDQEILEAEKVIVGLKNDLTVIAGTTDAEKLVTLVRDNGRRMRDSFAQLIHHTPMIFGSISDYDTVLIGLLVLWSIPDQATRSVPKAKLLSEVAQYAPRVDAVLVKTAQTLSEIASK